MTPLKRPTQRVEDDDSGGSYNFVFLISHLHPMYADEVDQISTRTLAIARYKHNHDWMNDVFCQAAYRMA